MLKRMEVHFTFETEKKLKDLSAQSGRGMDDLVEDGTGRVELSTGVVWIAVMVPRNLAIRAVSAALA